MSEDRFKTEEENMADYMAQRLPRSDTMRCSPPFYGEAWNWYIDHLELMELFSKIPESQVAFQKCLELCKEKDDPALFAVALALRKEKLQMGQQEMLFL